MEVVICKVEKSGSKSVDDIFYYSKLDGGHMGIQYNFILLVPC